MILTRPFFSKGPLALCALTASCTSASSYLADFAAYDAGYIAAQAPREHRITRGEWTLAAREYGVEHRGASPSVVLMHGFPDSMHLYDLVVPQLAEERHVITFDFLGWGDSDKPKDHRYDFRSLDADLGAVMDHFRPRAAVLVAHDISGPAAVDRALRDADVESLVLLNTVLYISPSLVRPEAIELFSSKGVWRNFLAWGAKTFDTAWIRRYKDQMSRFVVTEGARTQQLIRALAAQSFGIRSAFMELNSNLRPEMKSRSQRLDEVRALDKPVAIVFGEDDAYLNVGVARELHALFPRSSLTVVEDASHFVQIDRPERVAAEILRFTAAPTRP